MTSTSDDASRNMPVESPEDETETDSRGVDVSLELPDGRRYCSVPYSHTRGSLPRAAIRLSKEMPA
jgi:hypothetical protein